jgi:hypothetical protein
MTNDLDALLSAPFAEVADDGFSATVARRALAQSEQRRLFEYLVILVAVGACLIVFALTVPGNSIETLVAVLENSRPVAIAFAALVLTASFARLVVDRRE